mmetsp:Transcript_18186/g.43476  ORF Transcript_18186/g.43476 Transcript_18186/m.43476 type:complete len:186 (-) Transcript_18186:2652-3209(-)
MSCSMLFSRPDAAWDNRYARDMWAMPLETSVSISREMCVGAPFVCSTKGNDSEGTSRWKRDTKKARHITIPESLTSGNDRKPDNKRVASEQTTTNIPSNEIKLVRPSKKTVTSADRTQKLTKLGECQHRQPSTSHHEKHGSTTTIPTIVMSPVSLPVLMAPEARPEVILAVNHVQIHLRPPNACP